MASISAKTFVNGSLRIAFKAGNIRWIEVDVGKARCRLHLFHGIPEEAVIIRGKNQSRLMTRKAAFAFYVAAEREGLVDIEIENTESWTE